MTEHEVFMSMYGKAYAIDWEVAYGKIRNPYIREEYKDAKYYISSTGYTFYH